MGHRTGPSTSGCAAPSEGRAQAAGITRPGRSPGRALRAPGLAGRVFGALRRLSLAGACCVLAGGALAGAPARVVSINVCTDQLAMLLAAPGQLVSVSFVARDGRVSAMAREAHAFPVNHGRAEEIHGLAPDLVLAGVYSDRATLTLLLRLGIAVVEVPVVRDLDGVAGALRLVGQARGREKAAEAEVAAFEARRARLALLGDATRPRAALYGPNGYTSGPRSLSGSVLALAGFDNIAAARGIDYGHLPLEVLVMEAPDLVVTGQPYPGTSRAEELLRHPALAGRRGAGISDADWVCGTPHVLAAAERLARTRATLAGEVHR